MKSSSRLSAGIFSLLVIAVSLLAVVNRQNIYDWVALRGYEPPQRVVALADSTTMLPSTRKVFYVNRPELNDKSVFLQNCGAGEQSIVLGCFIEHKGIFLLDVSDPRLNGIVEVTAAHEVLHAAYERLDASERDRVDRMTADFYKNLNNERIQKTVENYKKKDPSIVPNELHSILATEVRNLSPELEAYYSRYFSDRKQIVSFSEKYEATFVRLENQAKSYINRIENLKRQIEAKKTEYQEQERTVRTQRERLDTLRSSGRIEEYNAAVPVYNSEVNQLNSIASTINRLIAEHNSLVEEYNETAIIQQELVEAIDSSVETKPPAR